MASEPDLLDPLRDGIRGLAAPDRGRRDRPGPGDRRPARGGRAVAVRAVRVRRSQPAAARAGPGRAAADGRAGPRPRRPKRPRRSRRRTGDRKGRGGEHAGRASCRGSVPGGADSGPPCVPGADRRARGGHLPAVDRGECRAPAAAHLPAAARQLRRDGRRRDGVLLRGRGGGAVSRRAARRPDRAPGGAAARAARLRRCQRGVPAGRRRGGLRRAAGRAGRDRRRRPGGDAGAGHPGGPGARPRPGRVGGVRQRAGRGRDRSAGRRRDRDRAHGLAVRGGVGRGAAGRRPGAAAPARPGRPACRVAAAGSGSRCRGTGGPAGCSRACWWRRSPAGC